MPDINVSDLMKPRAAGKGEIDVSDLIGGNSGGPGSSPDNPLNEESQPAQKYRAETMFFTPSGKWEAAARTLQKKGLEAKAMPDNVAVRDPDGKWRVLDDPTKFSWSDVTDLGGDVANMAGMAYGAAKGATLAAPLGPVAAVGGGILGAGAGSAATEATKASIGKMLGFSEATPGEIAGGAGNEFLAGAAGEAGGKLIGAGLKYGGKLLQVPEKVGGAISETLNRPAKEAAEKELARIASEKDLGKGEEALQKLTGQSEQAGKSLETFKASEAARAAEEAQLEALRGEKEGIRTGQKAAASEAGDISQEVALKKGGFGMERAQINEQARNVAKELRAMKSVGVDDGRILELQGKLQRLRDSSAQLGLKAKATGWTGQMAKAAAPEAPGKVAFVEAPKMGGIGEEVAKPHISEAPMAPEAATEEISKARLALLNSHTEQVHGLKGELEQLRDALLSEMDEAGGGRPGRAAWREHLQQMREIYKATLMKGNEAEVAMRTKLDQLEAAVRSGKASTAEAVQAGISAAKSGMEQKFAEARPAIDRMTQIGKEIRSVKQAGRATKSAETLSRLQERQSQSQALRDAQVKALEEKRAAYQAGRYAPLPPKPPKMPKPQQFNILHPVRDAALLGRFMETASPRSVSEVAGSVTPDMLKNMAVRVPSNIRSLIGTVLSAGVRWRTVLHAMLANPQFKAAIEAQIGATSEK